MTGKKIFEHSSQEHNRKCRVSNSKSKTFVLGVVRSQAVQLDLGADLDIYGLV